MRGPRQATGGGSVCSLPLRKKPRSERGSRKGVNHLWKTATTNILPLRVEIKELLYPIN